MTVYFSNREPLDLQALYTMGLSVKETENPIGMFGTGLKYAIAILLRERADLQIIINGEPQPITLESKSFRGQPFDQPHINGKPLPFSLDLGKHWSLWQAYRELASNTRDEIDGTIGTEYPFAAGTIIAVTLPAFTAIHEANDIFLESKPLANITNCEVHPESSMNFYYRGVKVYESEELPFTLTYNSLTHVTLTEDRTLKNFYELEREVGWTVRNLTDRALINKVLNNPNLMEFKLACSGSCSSEFEQALFERREDVNLPEEWQTIIDDLVKRTKKERFEHYFPTEDELELLREARQLLIPLDVPTALKLSFTTSLGEGTYAVYSKTHGIVISKSCFDNRELLAHAIYEEYLHMTTGMEDETRQLQTYLFRKIIKLSERLST